MEIIRAKTTSGKEVPIKQIKKDWKQLKELHQKALKEQPTWSVFGGILTIEDREYQVK